MSPSCVTREHGSRACGSRGGGALFGTLLASFAAGVRAAAEIRPSGYGDDSYHRHLQDEQLPPSDYVVENVDDRRNGGASAVDTGGMQMTQSSDHRHSSSSMSSPGKLFVGRVSWETTEETFAKYFEKFGKVVDSVIMRDRMTGKPRGFGFVTFAYSDVEENVLEEEHVIDDCKFLEDTGIVTSNRYQKLGKSLCGGLPPFLEEVLLFSAVMH
ncbi:hypothetical protein Bca52824_023232 [Brassica carinata]|uniref:RRM domain-containing protein n=1 Tax=Brassica carinata TaxID=52824 RepID=A0A8X7VHU6_BRACI|nr:hypothetical protein Bca52824_023232 [Brassica carinata]